MSKTVGATLVDDPEKHIAGGATLAFVARTFPIAELDVVTSAIKVENWEVFDGTVLAVAIPRGKSDSNFCGSAVMVAPGIAIGALHIVDQELIASGKLSAVCIGVRGERMEMWHVTHMTTSQDQKSSDLAVYSLRRATELPRDLVFPQTLVSTRTPRVGERLTIVGFRSLPAPHAEVVTKNKQGNVVRGLRISMYRSSGLVTQQHPQGRDSHMLPFPCVEVEASTLGGMSGGPAFDELGRFVGVLTTGISEGPSWVSLVWPALMWNVVGGWPKALMRGNPRLMDLDDARCPIDGRWALARIGDMNTYVRWEDAPPTDDSHSRYEFPPRADNGFNLPRLP